MTERQLTIAAGVFAAVPCSLILGAWVLNSLPPAKRPAKPLTAEERAEWAVRAANGRCQRAVDTSLAPVEAVFVKARAGARGYAEEVTSWTGAGELVMGTLNRLESAVTGANLNTDRHERYLAAEFTRRVLDPDDLRRAVDAAAEAFAAEVQAAEAELLVKLRADLPGAAVPQAAGLSDAAFRERLREQMARAGRAAEAGAVTNAAASAATLVVPELVGMIARRAATRLGVGAAVVGGTPVALATGVATVLFGHLVDDLVATVFRHLGLDGTANAEAEVVSSLGGLEAAVVAAARDEMEKVAAERRALHDGYLAERRALHDGYLQAASGGAAAAAGKVGAK